VRPAEEALAAAARLAAARHCEGYLLALARYVPTLLARRHMLLRLPAEARVLLRRLAAATMPVVQAGSTGEAPAQLDLNPFGAGSASIDGTPVDTAALEPKARELLFYLTLRGAPVHRAEAIDALWPDDATTRAVAALKRALYNLRCMLGEQCLPAYESVLVLQATVHDAGHELAECTEDACAACGAGDFPGAAASLTRAGAHLEAGLYLPWCESQWAAEARAYYLDLARRLATLSFSVHQPPAAAALQRCCRALTILEPTEEAGWEGIMRWHRHHGQLAEALRTWEAYDRICRAELDQGAPLRLRRLATTPRVRGPSSQAPAVRES